MRRRTISEHESDISASSISRNSRLIAEYNNLESSFEQSNMDSFEQQRNMELGNSKQTLKNKAASRIKQLDNTGHRLIDTSSYYVPVEGRKARSFLNTSLRERTRLERYNSQNSRREEREQREQESKIDSSDKSELITLPQPSPTSVQMGYLLYLNRHKGLSKPYDFAKQVLKRNHDISIAEQFDKSHHRCYQQAKLRYHDNMMPQKLKVGNNALKMYKYRQKKRQNSRMLIQLADI